MDYRRQAESGSHSLLGQFGSSEIVADSYYGVRCALCPEGRQSLVTAKNGVPIWANFMMKAHDSLPVVGFEEPEGIVHADVCLESGELATERCEQVRNEVLTEDSQPTSYCHLHPARPLRLSSSQRNRHSQGHHRRPGAFLVDSLLLTGWYSLTHINQY